MNNYSPAGFFLRLLAFLNETLVFLLLSSIFLWNLSKSNTLSSIYYGIIVFLVIFVFYSILGMVYNVLFIHWFGGNLGKLVTGLRVKDESGNKLDLKKIIFRQLLSYQFSWLVFGLGYLSILKDPSKQAWHDKTVDSNVFKVQSLLPLSLTVFFLTLGASGYLLKSSFNNFLNSPAKQEVLGLIAAFNEPSQKISKERQDQQFQVYDLIKVDKLDEASKIAQQMLDGSKTDSEKALSMQTIGEVHASKLNYSTAKIYFTDALKLDQSLPGAYIGLAAANIKEKDFQQAIVNAQKAIDLAPTITEFYYILGLAYYGAGEKDKAIQSIEKAIKDKPGVEEYKNILDTIKNSTVKTPSTKTQPRSATSKQSSSLSYTQDDVKSWKDELSYIDEDLANIQHFSGNSSYDQGKLNEMSTILNQRRAIANQIYTKMINNQTLTTKDQQDINTYDQLTSQYGSLASQVFQNR